MTCQNGRWAARVGTAPARCAARALSQLLLEESHHAIGKQTRPRPNRDRLLFAPQPLVEHLGADVRADPVDVIRKQQMDALIYNEWLCELVFGTAALANLGEDRVARPHVAFQSPLRLLQQKLLEHVDRPEPGV